MPNLWYSRTVDRTFDLKGSLRGRLVDESEDVALDKNFIKLFEGFPVALQDASKQSLHKAIHNDTLFLSRSEVVDYSLLVGIDYENNQLVLGIVDYLRFYTWDKMLEDNIKSTRQ